MLLVAAGFASTASAWFAEACSPTAPQTFLPDVNLPLFDSALPPVAFDGGAEPVRVVVASTAGPSVGTTVVFHDASGKAVGSAKTDSLGRAELVVPAGGGVTILMGSIAGGTLSALTYLSVEPGDLLLAFDKSATPPNPLVTLQSLPSPTPNGATTFTMWAGNCPQYFNAPPAAEYVFPYCFDPAGRFPMLVEAFDNGSNNLGFSFVKDQVIDVDASTASVWMDAATWSNAQATWTATLTNTSASYPSAVFSEVANNVPIPHVASPQATGDGGFLPQQWSFHPGYADFFQTEVNVSTSVQSNVTFSVVATRSPASTKDGSVTIDLGQLPPAISSVTADYTTTPGRPTVTFKPDAPIPSAVGEYAVFSWTNQIDGSGSVLGFWTIVAPPTMTTVTAPELPASASDWAPTALLNSFPPEVVVISGDGLKSYADFRKAAAAIPPPNYNNLPQTIAPMLPFDGTLTLSAVGPNPG